MKQSSFTSIHHFFMWLCLATAIIVGWSCQKSDLLQKNQQQAEKSISQARSFYERTVVPLTKTLGEQQIPIKPLPGEMTPQWERAAATVFENDRRILI